MVLLIALGHRTNHLLNERNLILCQLVRLVEHLVCPLAIHWELGNEGKALTVQVLRVRSQRDKEADKLGTQIRAEIRSFRLSAEPTGNEVSLGAGGPGAADQNPGEDTSGATFVRLSAMLACRPG